MGKGGPTTDSGKAASSRNAIRHAVMAAMPVVPGMEREEDWEAHRAGILESLSPQGPLETFLAERVALQSWRLNRVARYETGAIVNAQERVVDNSAGDWRRPTRTSVDAEEVAEELKTRRSTVHNLQQLSAMSDDAPLDVKDAGVIIDAAEMRMKNANRQDAHVSFMPDDMYVHEYLEWTAGKVRELLTSMANADGAEREAFLAAPLKREQADLSALEAIEEARRAAASARIVREQRDHLLPSYLVMEKVARYEAHLSREFYKALHELEAVRDRREGRAAPLARLEVNGFLEK